MGRFLCMAILENFDCTNMESFVLKNFTFARITGLASQRVKTGIYISKELLNKICPSQREWNIPKEQLDEAEKKHVFWLLYEFTDGETLTEAEDKFKKELHNMIEVLSFIFSAPILIHSSSILTVDGGTECLTNIDLPSKGLKLRDDVLHILIEQYETNISNGKITESKCLTAMNWYNLAKKHNIYSEDMDNELVCRLGSSKFLCYWNSLETLAIPEKEDWSSLKQKLKELQSTLEESEQKRLEGLISMLDYPSVKKRMKKLLEKHSLLPNNLNDLYEVRNKVVHDGYYSSLSKLKEYLNQMENLSKEVLLKEMFENDKWKMKLVDRPLNREIK